MCMELDTQIDAARVSPLYSKLDFVPLGQGITIGRFSHIKFSSRPLSLDCLQDEGIEFSDIIPFQHLFESKSESYNLELRGGQNVIKALIQKGAKLEDRYTAVSESIDINANMMLAKMLLDKTRILQGFSIENAERMLYGHNLNLSALRHGFEALIQNDNLIKLGIDPTLDPNNPERFDDIAKWISFLALESNLNKVTDNITFPYEFDNLTNETFVNINLLPTLIRSYRYFMENKQLARYSGFKIGLGSLDKQLMILIGLSFDQVNDIYYKKSGNVVPYYDRVTVNYVINSLSNVGITIDPAEWLEGFNLLPQSKKTNIKDISRVVGSEMENLKNYYINLRSTLKLKNGHL